jgi:limonene-1,2-epoxide hydrolase
LNPKQPRSTVPDVTPEEVVRAELRAWEHADIDEILSYLAADAVWHMVQYAPIRGHNELRAALEGYLRNGKPTEFEILNLAVAGHVVMTERVDRWVIKNEPREYQVMSTFEVTGEMISAVREYGPF